MANETEFYCGDIFPHAAVLEGFCVHKIPDFVDKPRSIIAVDTSGFLVFERGTSEVLWVKDTNGDGVPDTHTQIGAEGGNHGLAYRDGYIYISSDTKVFRWKYTLGNDRVEGPQERVIENMNANGMGGAPGGHTTRTLVFDEPQGRLYVSVGSAGNVDVNSYRSRIRRFDVSDPSTFPIDFQTGEVFADGLRNEVGLGFDRHGVLWGVENGADNLRRDDLGGDIHNDNPAEELNRFPEDNAGKHYGYPECWTEYRLDDGIGLGPGTSWVWPSFLDRVTDEQCRTDRVQSELAMQAHSAPLGIVFYNHTDNRPEGCAGTFPAWMDGFAFIAFHGSWNRDIPTGYKVVYVPMTPNGRVNATEPIDLLYHAGNDAQWGSGFRPVDVDFDDCGRLLVTSDGTRERGSAIVRLAYNDGQPMACCGNTNQVLDPSTGTHAHSGVFLPWILTFLAFAALLDFRC